MCLSAIYLSNRYRLPYVERPYAQRNFQAEQRRLEVERERRKFQNIRRFAEHHERQWQEIFAREREAERREREDFDEEAEKEAEREAEERKAEQERREAERRVGEEGERKTRTFGSAAGEATLPHAARRTRPDGSKVCL